MAQYEVLRPIEYNGKLYVPASDNAPAVVRSASNGGDIPVDRSGVINLPDSAIRQFELGQIAPFKEKAAKNQAKPEAQK